ncbi:RNA polymerase sporulation sigma factor SigF [Anaerosacchariphilus polymeriproducens]|uniref:RNA polymerase sigma factor n=1 Tax=Anaerosacchariphilus polymeriproducens TaxID=1812858 RepID=A0A371ARR8_9FIRM|nr:RNA polymerase sporulation sigma factor SigF [Anaerosacchariphilus polymeriproducens]RDU22263.1 RNA polymerase sporulation sigma factor SigF [Anaerosacchariphilus polymeriproducens]
MDKVMELIKRSQEGDKGARDKLVQDNLGLVKSIIRRFAGRGHEMEDLFQIGTIGLMKAIDKFDLSFDVKFSTYAVPMITGEVKRFLRDDGMIKVSRSLKEIANKVRITKDSLNGTLNREPTLEEIAQELNMEREDIVMALEAVGEVESLQKTIYQGDGSAISLMDKIEEDKNPNEELLNHLVLQQLMDKLEEKEKTIIYMRYFLEKTQAEVAKKLEISQVQVSRIEKKTLLRMRQMINN